MNIVLDCERMKYPNTGLYTFCHEYAKALDRVVSAQDELTFYTYKNTGKFMGEDARYLVRNLWHKMFPVNAAFADIWHTTYQLSSYHGGGRKTKNVLTVHDLNFLYEKADRGDYAERVAKHQRLIDRADHIVTISDFAKKDVLEHLDTKGKPVTTIYNGCNPIDYSSFDSPEYRPDRPFIFAIGTIIPKKNFHVLPAILAKNDYELIIAGNESDYVAVIMAEAKRHGVEDRVKIVGPISESEKFWYLRECLAFAFPSIAEGFGMPIVEAMNFGKPVFASNLTSLPEIGGDMAYYFDNFDAEYMQDVFERSMNHYDENQPAEAIKKYISKFDWNNTAEEYYKVYQSLVK